MSQPEYLDYGSGGPLPPEPRRSRKPLVLAVAGVAGLALTGGVAFAALWYFGEGAQSAEAFPAESVAYVGVTLDPSGSQKLEALETLQKFPTVSEELGLEGDASDIDVKRELAEAVLSDAPCDDLTYEDDIEPWLGDRFGISAVLVDGEPQPVGAVEITDPDAAASGVDALLACGGSETDSGQGVFEVDGDWLMVADTQEVLDEVADLKSEGTLDGDADFQRWTGQSGGDAIVTMYAAPSARDLILDLVAEEMADATTDPFAEDPFAEDPFAEDPFAEDPFAEEEPFVVEPSALGAAAQTPAPEVPEELREALEGFEGAAAQLRFEDGALELQGAAGLESELTEVFGEPVGDLVASLPADTAVAYGLGLGDGWFAAMLDYVATSSGGLLSAEEVADELESTTGLTGEDLEAAAGDGAVLAVGSDVDTDTLTEGELAEVPLALLLGGDEDAVTLLSEALTPLAGPDEELLQLSAGDNGVAVGADPDYREAVASGEGETLGDTERFRTVAPDAEDSDVVMYVDLDTLDPIVEGFMEAFGGETDEEVLDNIRPLAAFGGTSSYDDGEVSMRFRLTTE